MAQRAFQAIAIWLLTAIICSPARAERVLFDVCAFWMEARYVPGQMVRVFRLQNQPKGSPPEAGQEHQIQFWLYTSMPDDSHAFEISQYDDAGRKEPYFGVPITKEVFDYIQQQVQRFRPYPATVDYQYRIEGDTGVLLGVTVGPQDLRAAKVCSKPVTQGRPPALTLPRK